MSISVKCCSISRGSISAAIPPSFTDAASLSPVGPQRGYNTRVGRDRSESKGKAIAYTSGLSPGLVRFLANPRIPLGTNSVERALRGVAVGRKNHYGSRSERGTRVAALLYSLIESVKLCGVEPRAYLREAALRAVRNPGSVTLARDLKSPEA